MDFSGLGENIVNLGKDAITFICRLNKPDYPEKEIDENLKREIKALITNEKKDKSHFVSLVSKYYGLNDADKKELEKAMVQDKYKETAELLLRKKFDFEFENEHFLESLKVTENYDFDLSSHFDVYAVDDKDSTRYFIFRVQSKNKQTGFQSDTPVYGNIHDYHLIKLDKKENCLEIRGGKYGYKRITNLIKESDFSVEESYNVEKSVLDKNFFTEILKSINFRVLGIKYGSKTDLSLNIFSSKKDVGSIINSFLLFSDEIDLLNLNELELEYSDTENNSIECTLRLDRNYNAGYYELKLISKSSSEENALIKDKIAKNFGVHIDKKYSLYQGCYLMKLFNSNNRKYWWEKIKDSESNFEKVISNLESMMLISEQKKTVRLDVNGLANYLKSCIHKIKDRLKDNFLINNVFLEDNLVRFYGFFTERSTNNKKLFSFAISFKDNVNNSLDYTDLDWYKILNANLKNEKEKLSLLDYFFNKFKFYQLIQNSFFNNKSIESYMLLSDIKNTLHSYEDDGLRGQIFESNINDLLLGIYPHYLPLGKKERPDGLLYLKAGETLLVLDAKSKKNIDGGDVDEMIRYLKGDYLSEKVVPFKEKIGVYVFDDELIQSLGFPTLKKRIDGEKKTVGYISSTFLTKYFYFLKQNLKELLLDPSILESCSKEILKLIRKNSSDRPLLNKKQVLQNEELCLEELNKCITQNIPQIDEIEKHREKN